MNATDDDRYARLVERHFGLQPRIDDDEQSCRTFADLTDVEKSQVVAEFVRKFGLQYLTDALDDLDSDSLLQAYELGDGAMGSYVRRCITGHVGPVIDRAVQRGEFELEG